MTESYNFKHNYPELSDSYKFEEKYLTKNKNKINFVITHGNCPDGFMSATVVRKWLRENKNIDDVEFLNVHHGEDFSNLPELMRDKYVLICDFSFQKLLFDKMIETTGGNILMLDHHKTAQKNLQDVPNEYLTFDMNHSGAFITWTFMYGFENVPKAVLYVEDNDIWTKCLPFTREFTAYMYTQPFEFEEYDKFFDDTYLTETVFTAGSGMVVQNNLHINNISKKIIPRFMNIDKRYYFVACLNSAGILQSELGNNAFNNYKYANFSMIYSHDMYKNTTNISYRSTDDRSDTTKISKLTGGGGHRNASGTKVYHVTNVVPNGSVIDDYRAYWLLENAYVINVNNIKFICINTPFMQTHLCNYLLQERFYDDENNTKNKNRIDNNEPGYQEGMFCMRYNTHNNDLDEYYHAALTWAFDGKNYNVVIIFIKQIEINIDTELLDEKNVEYEFVNKRSIRLKLPSHTELHKWLDCLIK